MRDSLTLLANQGWSVVSLVNRTSTDPEQSQFSV